MAELKGIQAYPQVAIDFSPKIPPLKKEKDKTQINVRYALMPPFTFAHIYWNPKIMEVVYEIEEPVLDKTEMGLKNEIISSLQKLSHFSNLY